MSLPHVNRSGSCQVVVAAHTGDTPRSAYKKIIPPGCELFIYVKNATCAAIGEAAPSPCMELPDVGRDAHVFMYYIVQHYEFLPDQIFFTSGHPEHHSKWNHLAEDCQRNDFGRKPTDFCCASRMSACDGFPKDVTTGETPLSDMFDATMENYDGRAVTPDLHEPLHNWLTYYMPYAEDAHLNAHTCHYLAVGTTKENLLYHPKSTYESILQDLGANNNPEAGFFAEWSAQVLFGAQSM